MYYMQGRGLSRSPTLVDCVLIGNTSNSRYKFPLMLWFQLASNQTLTVDLTLTRSCTVRRVRQRSYLWTTSLTTLREESWISSLLR